ncbi:MAG: SNF2 helicase associated domain-containing protein, partial [Planctomycetales bacterium]|nr:SNF2 helicase associated domain-containing protein [Planctomycetales bacterium]
MIDVRRLLETLPEDISRRVRAEAGYLVSEAFFENLVEGEEDIRAEVGTEEDVYRVSILAPHGNYVFHKCSCQGEVTKKVCAHVLALVLYLNGAREMLQSVDEEDGMDADDWEITPVLQVAAHDADPVHDPIVPMPLPWLKDSTQRTPERFVPRRLPASPRARLERQQQNKQLCFAIDLGLSREAKLLVLVPMWATGVNQAGEVEYQRVEIRFDTLNYLYDLNDQVQINELQNLTVLATDEWQVSDALRSRISWKEYSPRTGQGEAVFAAFVVSPRDQDAAVLRLISKNKLAWRTGRANGDHDVRQLPPRSYTTGEFRYRVATDETSGEWIMTPVVIRSDGQEVALRDALYVSASGGILWTDGWTGNLGMEMGPWLAMAYDFGEVRVAPDEQQAAMGYWQLTPLAGAIDWPVAAEPQSVVRCGDGVIVLRRHETRPDIWEVRLGVRYGDSVLEFPRDQYAVVFDDNANALPRDWIREQEEQNRVAKALACGPIAWLDTDSHSAWSFVGTVSDEDGVVAECPSRDLIEFCLRMAPICEVLLDGRAVKSRGNIRIEVESGIDWLDVSGQLSFDGDTSGDATARLPELLAAARRGDSLVRLSDGSMGVIPDEAIERLKRLVDSLPEGSTTADEQGTMRFARSQALLLDALLAAESIDAKFDASFSKLLKSLRNVRGIKPSKPARSFQGELREYQQAGLGWFKFLNQFRFGGCLADEMGLGKTVQVLSLLEHRRLARAKDDSIGPSIVVVPKSLLFNWQAEAARFAPRLRTHISAGIDRKEWFSRFDEFDLIITTYPTLVRDIPELVERRFDYAILDEAQAIKNPQTQASKACRLLRAEHRLALTGTPIENHLGELWSLFEFLNPGMLGRSKQFAQATRNPTAESVELITRAVSPFILRRTKQQVLPDLPDKVQESLYCELGVKQRKLYNELRDHYRKLLTDSVARKGLNKSKLVVLEALLRLRQAACHPGLISAKHAKLDSAKFDELLGHLPEIIEGGHKAIIFSQFTSLLALLQKRLKAAGYRWAYLDGQTNDRQAVVHKF